MEHSPTLPLVAEDFAQRFRFRAKDSNGALAFADFMDLALYDEAVGYYRKDRRRVGRAPGADFYTSASFEGVFGPLVAAAATTLLGEEKAGTCVFVEIGAEPGQHVLDGVAHPFRSTRTLRIGDALDLDGPAVVFSNELFDAQPFHRVVFRAGGWQEVFVRGADGRLTLIETAMSSPEVLANAARLPASAPEGYVLDLPLRAETLARTLATRPWRGLFLAFDYGRTWAQLTSEYPAGTGRAYRGHAQSGDLLADPGNQDLTSHVCWDWLEAALGAANCVSITRESQEAFFLRRATDTVSRIVSGDPNPLSRHRTQLKQLLHPGMMGQRFEALWALKA